MDEPADRSSVKARGEVQIVDFGRSAERSATRYYIKLKQAKSNEDAAKLNACPPESRARRPRSPNKQARQVSSIQKKMVRDERQTRHKIFEAAQLVEAGTVFSVLYGLVNTIVQSAFRMFAAFVSSKIELLPPWEPEQLNSEAFLLLGVATTATKESRGRRPREVLLYILADGQPRGTYARFHNLALEYFSVHTTLKMSRGNIPGHLGHVEKARIRAERKEMYAKCTTCPTAAQILKKKAVTGTKSRGLWRNRTHARMPFGFHPRTTRASHSVAVL
ncbi:hypothetical protein DFH06DRAFT_1420129 [Mycena polygramma]|nr:hypothetical protein DFH06DRAFT_1420129 [Mycena polygramma]